MIGIDTQLELLLFVIFAAVLGGIIGFEREVDGHSAGFRTHIFVAAASAGFMLLGSSLFESVIKLNPQGISSDPFRLLEAIFVTVGIIGGGIILKDEKEHQVRNLTTAGSILFTAIIGIAVGVQYLYLAIGLTILALITNYFLLQFQKKFHPLKHGLFK